MEKNRDDEIRNVRPFEDTLENRKDRYDEMLAELRKFCDTTSIGNDDAIIIMTARQNADGETHVVDVMASGLQETLTSLALRGTSDLLKEYSRFVEETDDDPLH